MFIVGLLVLKEPIRQAIPRLQRLKYKELEAEFDRELGKIEQEVEDAGMKTIEDADVVDDFQENLRQISEISPDAAIVEAFRKIESSAKKLIEAKGLAPDYKTAAPYRLIEQILDKTDALGEREVKIFRDLRLLRNKVTHADFSASRGQAEEYIKLASVLILKIDEAVAIISNEQIADR